MKAYDVIIVGGGHNGLITAYYLAAAGLRTLVLERLEHVGGAAVTGELCPGFRCPTLAHATGPIRPEVLRDLRLERFGLQLVRPDPQLLALGSDGRHVTFHDDTARSAAAISKISARDGARFPEFVEALGAVSAVIGDLLWRAPPAVDGPTPTEVWHLIRSGRRFHGLGRTNGFRLLRWLPAAVADVVAEWFESDLVRAVVASRGLFGRFAGPCSPGTGGAMVLQAALSGSATAPLVSARGGLGAITQAMAAAATAAGAEIRTEAEVGKVLVKDGVAVGVALATGEELSARGVVSNADPRRTFLGLLDQADLTPDFANRIRRYRCAGVAAKVNLALESLPAFPALEGLPADQAQAALAGRIHVGPDLDYLESAFDAAKYGRFSGRPYLDVTIPSIIDPGLAPDGQHVISIYAQYAPMELRNADWHTERDALGDVVVAALAEHAPDIEDRLLHREVITPADFEATFGLTGGDIFHGEHTFDQLFAMRPLLGHAQYRCPIRGLYLCGAGTHPGGGVTGACAANASREILKDFGRRAR